MNAQAKAYEAFLAAQPKVEWLEMTEEEFNAPVVQTAEEELVAFVKANPIKRNKSGSLNGNSVGKLADKWQDRFGGRQGYSIAYRIIEEASK